MLTIQPITTNTYSQKPLSFKAEDWEISREQYREHRAFYENQIHEADKILSDDYAPKMIKKGMNWFKIISGAIIEGWAVLWGASTLSKGLKTGTIKALNSKLFKAVQGKTTKAGEFISEKFANSNMFKKGSEILEKMNKDKYGQYIIQAGNVIISGAKKVANFVGKPFAGKSAGEIYDKGAKTVATTLGVGSGLTSVYGSVRKENLQKIAQDVDTENLDIEDEVA